MTCFVTHLLRSLCHWSLIAVFWGLLQYLGPHPAVQGQGVLLKLSIIDHFCWCLVLVPAVLKTSALASFLLHCFHLIWFWGPYLACLLACTHGPLPAGALGLLWDDTWVHRVQGREGYLLNCLCPPPYPLNGAPPIEPGLVSRSC